MKRLLYALSILIVVSSLAVSFHASAALINVADENYFTDDSTGLDWLDLTATRNMWRGDALAANSGYRFATNDEVVDISRKTFGTYYGQPSANGSTTEYGIGPLYSAQRRFTTWFGGTGGGRDPLYDRISGNGLYGLYVDERGQPTLFGGIQWAANTKVTGLNYTGPFDSSPHAMVGTFLVRETPPEVPIPAAIWLFGTGLIALIGIARRKG